MQMVAARRINGPTLFDGNSSNVANSVKTVITGKNGRIEFFARNSTIVFRAPSRMIEKGGTMPPTSGRFKLNTVTTLRTNLSETTGCVGEIAKIVVAAIYGAIVAVVITTTIDNLGSDNLKTTLRTGVISSTPTTETNIVVAGGASSATASDKCPTIGAGS
jgi:hypothetical protein